MERYESYCALMQPYFLMKKQREMEYLIKLMIFITTTQINTKIFHMV